jgi:hypothetical protein
MTLGTLRLFGCDAVQTCVPPFAGLAGKEALHDVGGGSKAMALFDAICRLCFCELIALMMV